MKLYKLKNLSILQKFLFINFVVFILIGILTFFYVINVQPVLIKNKTSNHIKTLNNTIENINRLKIKFNEDEIRDFLFSTKFLFQNIDRVQIFDSSFKLIGDTDTLDLDPRAFSKRLDKIEIDDQSKDQKTTKVQNGDLNDKKQDYVKSNLKIYSKSKELGRPFTFTGENYDQFLLITIKNVVREEKNAGYIAITENANDIKSAINERKNFIIRTALAVIIVILIFSYVLNRYFLKPIKNLVSYTNIIKNKSSEKTNIENIKNRADELGTLSKSLDEMTNELNKRITTAENYSTDLLHEIRNPLTSLKSASDIISETENKDQRNKLINIVSHDVERIERLITDYSQMLKDEAAISSEKMKKIDLNFITNSVVDDFNSIYETKRSIKIKFENNNLKNVEILGIESRIEQIIANLLENSISFSEDNQEINVELFLKDENKIGLLVSDQGAGFDEKDTNKIFNRFYSNRPDKFGEHSGLGLNIVKNLVELHSGEISATNNKDKGARIEIIFPKI
ncbi:MAG: two-component sensor histidine kinase [Candidatus Pelagibacter sp.]|nr:two-component sensor histidine kinase [Candidatus Pelagibacter sp.]|tara:strand:+ start:168 stop:1700 length:1533 start_codon:yes stop_codon:yes gene_type:complete